MTFRRLGTVLASHRTRPASWSTRIALGVHNLVVGLESRHPRGSGDPGVIHAAVRYDLMWGWLLARTDRAIIRRLAVTPGERVLDLGCGPGNLTRSVANASGAAVGIDASPEMIDRARRHAGRELVTFASARAERLPFADGDFAAVVSRLLLHELPADELGAALAEVRRVLRPGGRALLIDLPGPALDQAHAEIEAAGLACETGTVGFPFLHFVSFRVGR